MQDFPDSRCGNPPTQFSSQPGLSRRNSFAL